MEKGRGKKENLPDSNHKTPKTHRSACDNPTNCARWQFVTNYIIPLHFIAQHVIIRKLVLSLKCTWLSFPLARFWLYPSWGPWILADFPLENFLTNEWLPAWELLVPQALTSVILNDNQLDEVFVHDDVIYYWSYLDWNISGCWVTIRKNFTKPRMRHRRGRVLIAKPHGNNLLA